MKTTCPTSRTFDKSKSCITIYRKCLRLKPLLYMEKTFIGSFQTLVLGSMPKTNNSDSNIWI